MVLSEGEKTDLVEVAKAVDIPTAHSKESQDVCFVLDGQANYLKGLLGVQSGDIIDVDTGKILGQHEGYYLFTLGQRKGLAVAAGRPVYVLKIDKENNIVYVGDAHHLEMSQTHIVDVNWLQKPLNTEFKSMVKYRYNTPAALATCEMLADGSVTVCFDEPATALSPGQVAAFYDMNDDELWGGGYIQAHLAHKPFDPTTAKLPIYDESCQLFK